MERLCAFCRTYLLFVFARAHCSLSLTTPQGDSMADFRRFAHSSRFRKFSLGVDPCRRYRAFRVRVLAHAQVHIPRTPRKRYRLVPRAGGGALLPSRWFRFEYEAPECV